MQLQLKHMFCSHWPKSLEMIATCFIFHVTREFISWLDEVLETDTECFWGGDPFSPLGIFDSWLPFLFAAAAASFPSGDHCSFFVSFLFSQLLFFWKAAWAPVGFFFIHLHIKKMRNIIEDSECSNVNWDSVSCTTSNLHLWVSTHLWKHFEYKKTWMEQIPFWQNS